jgi:hypothetical protein
MEEITGKMCNVPVRGKPRPVHYGVLIRHEVAQRESRQKGRVDVMVRGGRPRKHRIEVWCDDEELEKIKANAQDTKLSNSAFLRKLGQGYEPKSAYDRDVIQQLAKLHAEQEGLRGVLKQWLSEKSSYGPPIKSLLGQIEGLQMTIAKLVTEEARRL